MNSNALFGLETSSTAAAMVASSSGGLSMEQKMAEAKRREMEKQFKSQPQLVQSNNSSQSKPTSQSQKPKDLTSTLMNKNMMNMTRPQMSSNSMMGGMNSGMGTSSNQSGGIGLFNQKALPPTTGMSNMSMSSPMSTGMSPMMSTPMSMPSSTMPMSTMSNSMSMGGMMSNNSSTLSNSNSFGSLTAPQVQN